LEITEPGLSEGDGCRAPGSWGPERREPPRLTGPVRETMPTAKARSTPSDLIIPPPPWPRFRRSPW
jgi:hypothetical protein